MKFVLSLLALVMFGAAAHATNAPAPAGPATPDAVVTEMYQTYFDALNAVNESGDLSIMPSVFDQVPKYSTPELAARLKKASESEEMVIGWDFLVSGQDFKDLKLLSAEKTAGDDKSATVRVKTSNMGTETESDVALVNTDAGWKVSDFTFFPGKPEQTTLDEILKEGGV